jgi:N-acetyl-anhydromuramyl-L-alanine amidase AmpD
MKRFLAFLGRLFGVIAGLPATLTAWAKVIPISQVMKYVAEAEKVRGLPGSEKKKYVAEQLTSWAKSKGYTIPVAVMNWLIETAVNQFNERFYPPMP